jgi:hypothetical protein
MRLCGDGLGAARGVSVDGFKSDVSYPATDKVSLL